MDQALKKIYRRYDKIWKKVSRMSKFFTYEERMKLHRYNDLSISLDRQAGIIKNYGKH
jgi:hypothetical protein